MVTPPGPALEAALWHPLPEQPLEQRPRVWWTTGFEINKRSETLLQKLIFFRIEHYGISYMISETECLS